MSCQQLHRLQQKKLQRIRRRHNTTTTTTQRQQRKNPFYATLNQLKTRLEDGAAKPDLNAEKNSGQAVTHLVLETTELSS